ncbi:formylglycine-generating enzyme family protein [Nonomuraea typhae]|uniref:formylglycine-generating enzyme family protein n=1 Tax=Nonomuraea typhae TaxID=2603600 RepID=UPI001FE9C05E|nr:formylglycine-generating enzyme family protein [Nonomuraea typhae]
MSEPRAAITPSAAPVPHDDVAIPGGSFLMGDAFAEGYPADGETPVHLVRLPPFRMDATAVTAGMFAAFARETGYRTDAERAGSSAVFHLAVAASRSDVLGVDPAAPWWVTVRGADWRHPFGPLSRAEDGHPVVHVSWHDAAAYCAWAGRRLPTEAQWEYAARGGLAGRRFAWGDELLPEGRWMCNIWQGRFPSDNTAEDGWPATAPVRAYPANGYGLHEMSGNIWEWCADWFDVAFYGRSPVMSPTGPGTGERRVIRGGSYLCHDSYCHRYRVSARSATTPSSSSGNCGFRTVKPAG